MKKRYRYYFKILKKLNFHLVSNIFCFLKDKDFDKIDNRPYAEVYIYGNNGKVSDRLLCLVDTGADDIQVHTDVANDLDIDLNVEATLEDVETASGETVEVYKMPGMKIKIEGKIIYEDVLFGNNSIPLIGRRTILTAYEIGFNSKKWFFET